MLHVAVCSVGQPHCHVTLHFPCHATTVAGSTLRSSISRLRDTYSTHGLCVKAKQRPLLGGNSRWLSMLQLWPLLPRVMGQLPRSPSVARSATITWPLCRSLQQIPCARAYIHVDVGRASQPSEVASASHASENENIGLASYCTWSAAELSSSQTLTPSTAHQSQMAAESCHQRVATQG